METYDLQQKSNIIRNSFWGFFYKIFTLVIPFFIRTIIIHKLSIEYLGLNNLFASVLQILNMAELGFGSAVVYNLYKPLADQDDTTVNALMGYYKKVYRAIGLMILTIGLCFVPILPCFISGDIPDNVNIYFLYMISLISTVLSYLCFSYKSVLLNANQRKDILDKISLVCTIFKYIFQITILSVWGNFYLYYSIDIATTLLNSILLFISAKKLYPQFNERGELDVTIKKEIYVKVKGLMVYKLSGKTKNSFDSIILSAFLGLTVVGQYGNYYYILYNLSVLLASITSAVEATAGNRLVTRDMKTNHADFMKLTFVHSWVSGVCCVCLFCLYQHFMKMWVGESNVFPFYMVVCFCAYFFLLSSCEARNTYINAAGLWWENRFRAMGGAVTNLFLNIVFVKFWGIFGVILATLISVFAFDFVFTSRTLYRYCFNQEKIYHYFIWWVKQFLLTTVTCVCMFLICENIESAGIGGFIIKGVICVVGSNFLFWCFRKKVYCLRTEKIYNKDGLLSK